MAIKHKRVTRILFQTRKGAGHSPSTLWCITKHFLFSSLEIVKRNGNHACIMVGSYARSQRPKLLSLKNKFDKFQKENTGFFQEINDGHLFIRFNKNEADNVSNDDTGLCTQFLCIKEGRETDLYKGDYFVINESVFKSLDNGACDVVKKNQEVATANEFVGADVTSALLGGDEAAEYFHQFSSEVSNVA